MGVIRYVGMAQKDRAVVVVTSVNNGKSWREQNLLPAQSFPVPPNTTNLLIDNIPYHPQGNYEIRGVKVAKK